MWGGGSSYKQYMTKEKSENVRLRYCDGRDKYLHPMGNKIYIFDKTACRTINSVSRMIN